MTCTYPNCQTSSCTRKCVDRKDARIAELEAALSAATAERKGAMEVIEVCEDSIAKLERKVQHWQDRAEAAEAEAARLREAKDGAYEERNKVVAALARLFPSGLTRTDIPGWSADWHGCVYIDLPTGQVSWHFHDSQAVLFAGLPAYSGAWDGHDTDEKYRRLAALGGEHG